MKNPVAIISTEILYNKKIKDESVVVFGVIDLHRDLETNISFPGRDTISSLLPIEARQVSTYLKNLKEQNAFVKVERRYNSSSVFHIKPVEVFGTIEKEILLDVTLVAGAKRTYAKLTELVNNKTKVYNYNTLTKLAEKLQITRPTLNKHLNALIEKGYINHNTEEKTIEVIGAEKKNFNIIKEEAQQIKSTKRVTNIQLYKAKTKIKKLANELFNLRGEKFEEVKQQCIELIVEMDNSEETKAFLNTIKNSIIEARKNLNKPVEISFDDSDFEELEVANVIEKKKTPYGIIRGNVEELFGVLRHKDEKFSKNQEIKL